MKWQAIFRYCCAGLPWRAVTVARLQDFRAIAGSPGWSRTTAPYEFPDRPHMSALIGATHNARYVLFRDGDTASSGLELVAENGRPRTLQAEFDEALGSKARALAAMVEQEGKKLERPVWRDWGAKEFSVLGPENTVLVFTRMDG